MIPKDPISIVLAFNHCINTRDINGLSDLMAENHTFIDRDGTSYGPKSYMVAGWEQFFDMFPSYKNTFSKIIAAGNRVCALGFAYWTEDEPYDPVIWTATIENDLIAEWRIYEDSFENRKKFDLE